LPGTGWNAAPYLRAWSLETGDFIRGHAAGGEDIAIGVHGGRYEDAALAVVNGWK
jgi:hypothetical protein